MNNTQIAQEFEKSQAVLKGHFKLSSGLHSDTYIQCALALMNGKRAELLCKTLAEKVIQQLGKGSFDLVVAPAMGGVIVGYETAKHLGVDNIFCERVDGKFSLRRGFTIESGQKILVIEDVITTGKSSLETIKCIEDLGGEVVGEACLVDRSNGQAELNIPVISLMKVDAKTFAQDNIPEHLQNIPAIKPGSRWLKSQAS